MDQEIWPLTPLNPIRSSIKLGLSLISRSNQLCWVRIIHDLVRSNPFTPLVITISFPHMESLSTPFFSFYNLFQHFVTCCLWAEVLDGYSTLSKTATSHDPTFFYLFSYLVDWGGSAHHGCPNRDPISNGRSAWWYIMRSVQEWWLFFWAVLDTESSITIKMRSLLHNFPSNL